MLRGIVAALSVALALFALVFGLFVVMPLAFILDLPLKVFGRRGCVIKGDDGSFSIQLTPDSFKRRA